MKLGALIPRLFLLCPLLVLLSLVSKELEGEIVVADEAEGEKSGWCCEVEGIGGDDG